MADLTQKELNLLAYTLLGEAAGEGREGMEAVMWTIRNRAESGRFPDNPASVATQKNSKGVYQYSTWNTKRDGGNKPDTRFSTSDPKFKEALAVVQRVMAGEVEDPTQGATHYYSGNQKPAWFEAEGPAGEVKIGNHRFAARNTSPDAARTASDAAQLLATGRLGVRPQNPVTAYAPEPDATLDATPSESGLRTNVVRTVDINEKTGMPYPRLTPQPANGVQPKREAVRLSEMRTMPANAADLTGNAARASATNAAAIDKQPRQRNEAVAAVRTSQINKASAAKTDRGAKPPEPVKPAVQAQNKTVAQIGQEADNARMSGYRDIQEAGPSSKGAIPKPIPATPKPSVIKTAGTTLSDGTKLTVAGDVAMPAGVRPQIGKTATTFIKPAADPRRLPASDPGLAARSSARQNIAVERYEKQFQSSAKPKKTTTSIKPEEPTVEQVIAVRDRKPVAAGVKGAGRIASPIVLANGTIVAQPQWGSVAAQIAQASRIGSVGQGGAYTTNSYQQNAFQTVENQLMPAATNTPNWTGPTQSNDNNPKNDWHWW